MKINVIVKVIRNLKASEGLVNGRGTVVKWLARAQSSSVSWRL
jgi:hypothetical protein